jgi:DNA-binding NarL/FixJ family response regulator
MVRIIVADDHPLVLRGIEGLFDEAEFQITGLCADGAAALALIEQGACDVAVLDIHMPGVTGPEILAEVRRRGLPVKIVLLTSNIDDGCLLDVIRADVDGLVLKEAAAEVLVACVRAVCAGDSWVDRDAMSRALRLFSAEPERRADGRLTDRELDVARYVAQGLRNKEIARCAGISPGTVKMHLHNIYEKIGVGSRTELALYVRDRGLAEASVAS